jgi:tetratricopeptide (TPR) repeat protein
MYNAIQREVSTLNSDEIKIKPPAQTGPLRATSSADAERELQRITRELDADVVISGTVRTDGGVIRISPALYLSSRKLSDAPELEGLHPFGSTIEVPGDPSNSVALAEAAKRLATRARAVEQFLLGLDNFNVHRPDPALAYFSAASEVEGFGATGASGASEVLDLFLGKTYVVRANTAEDKASRDGTLETARGFYDRALQSRPGYDRPLLGTAEVDYLEARGFGPGPSEQGNIDIARMRTARQSYKSLVPDLVAAGLSIVQIKAAFGLGRVDWCLSQALVEDDGPESEMAYVAVINAYARSATQNDHLLLDMASESHAGLAAVYWPAANDPARQAAYQRTRDEYRKATDLCRFAERCAVFYANLGFVLGRLQDYLAADSAYATAIEKITASEDPRRQRLAADYASRRQQLRDQAASGG